MRTKQISLEKEESKINIQVFVCDCDTEMRKVGSAGCSHDSEYTFTYQCPSCKTIEMSEVIYPPYGNDRELFIKAGWVEVKE